jgi:alkyl sulfatase BDS1-like metallo-beta-lactamase superfamily hydrolase
MQIGPAGGYCWPALEAAVTPLLAVAPPSYAQQRAQSAAAKPPSEFTRAANRRVPQVLPFNDRSDFDDAQRGSAPEFRGTC